MISHNEIENSPIENNFLTYNDKINKFFIKYVTLINDFINYAVNNLPMDSPETFKTNIIGTMNILEAMRKNKVNRIIYLNS